MTQLTEGVEHSQSPEDMPFIQARIAREKIVNFKETDSLYHAASHDLLPLILNEGVLSHLVSMRAFSRVLKRGFDPQMQSSLTGGFKLISVHDPEVLPTQDPDNGDNKKTISEILSTNRHVVLGMDFKGEAGVLISDRIRGTDK